MGWPDDIEKSPSGGQSRELTDQEKALVRREEDLMAITSYMDRTGAGLLESKRAIDTYRAHATPDRPHPVTPGHAIDLERYRWLAPYIAVLISLLLSYYLQK